MNRRASQLISLLDLQPHMEGGYYRETFRSAISVQLPGERQERKALTTIYYLLAAGQFDSWHRIRGDEVWHHYEGADLELYYIDPQLETYTLCLLGQVGEANRPVAVVPGGYWQMARTTGDYTLVGCTVGPGFEFADFELMRDRPDEARELRRRFPELAEYLQAETGSA